LPARLCLAGGPWPSLESSRSTDPAGRACPVVRAQAEPGHEDAVSFSTNPVLLFLCLLWFPGSAWEPTTREALPRGRALTIVGEFSKHRNPAGRACPVVRAQAEPGHEDAVSY